MTSIQPISSAPVSTPNAGVSSNADLTKAIEKNSETAKTCAYVALGTSIATLLPLSVLALKASQMSKAVKNISDAAELVLKHADEAITDMGAAVKEGVRDIAGNILYKLDDVELQPLANKLEELTDVARSKLDDVEVKPLVAKVEGLVDKASEKLTNVDFQPIVENAVGKKLNISIG